MRFEHLQAARDQVRNALGADLAAKASVEFCLRFSGTDGPPPPPHTIIELVRVSPPPAHLDDLLSSMQGAVDWSRLEASTHAAPGRQPDEWLTHRARAVLHPLSLARSIYVDLLRERSVHGAASVLGALNSAYGALPPANRAMGTGTRLAQPELCWLNQSIRVPTDYAILAELAAHSDVTHLDLPRPLRREMDMTGRVVGAVRFRHDEQVTGAGITVAVLDGEIHADHPALAGRVEQTANFTTEGWGHPDPHATAVAGIIGSNGNRLGMAPEVTIHNYKLFENGRDPDDHDYALALECAVREKVPIVNCSWGSPAPTDGTSREVLACENAWGAGVTVVKSSGDTSHKGLVTCPADADGIIVVGASDREGVRIPPYSSRGGTLNKKPRPHLVAPGGFDGIGRIYCCTPAGDFEPVHSGTSLSAAHVSGLLALLLQANPGMTPTQQREFLITRCHPVDGWTSADFGAGLVKL
jgi:subtilisin family serine protease